MQREERVSHLCKGSKDRNPSVSRSSSSLKSSSGASRSSSRPRGWVEGSKNGGDGGWSSEGVAVGTGSSSNCETLETNDEDKLLTSN